MKPRAIVLVLALLLSPHAALARGTLFSSPPSSNNGGHGHSCGDHDLGLLTLEAFGAYLSPPSLAVNGSETPRRLVGVPAPTGGELFLGGGAGFEVRCDYLLWDIVSLHVASAIDSGATASSMADGTPVNVARNPLHLLDVGLPFFGIPSGFQVFPDPGWKIAFKLQWGMAHLWTSATVSGVGYVGAAGSVDEWNPYVQAQLAICSSMGKGIKNLSTPWACLTATPILYEKAWLPGVAVGLKVDL
jgi:hypothetical protein